MNTYLIKKKEDFSHVFRNGSYLNCNSFTINYAKKSKLASTNSPRFGIIASNKFFCSFIMFLFYLRFVQVENLVF